MEGVQSMNRKVIFWLEPNQSLVPVDQIPGAIAEARYPLPERSEEDGKPLNDTNVIPRLKEEREQAKTLRAKYPIQSDNFALPKGEVSDYLAVHGFDVEWKTIVDISKGPEERWAARQFLDGFNSVQSPVPIARRCPSEVSGERCIELANLQQLYIDHWIELVSVGIGQHHTYDVDSGCVKFIKHEDEYISLCPADWQVDMMRDNRTAPQLAFPCTPAELLNFVDSAIGIHCFMVPDAFRRLVTAENQNLGSSSHQEVVASSGAPESAEPSPRPIPAQRWQESEVLKAIGELGHDPKSLPKDESGKDGVKAMVRKKLSHHKWTTNVFDKAWERLSSTKEIVKLK